MKRLTKRLPGGAADYNYPASCYFDDDSGPDRMAQSAFRQRCVERLADYEDTRLTPEQCKNAKVIIESAFSNDTSKAERIRELMPTIDVVAVVRCRECKYCDGTPGQPNILCGQMHEDDFCSYGERKEGAD